MAAAELTLAAMLAISAHFQTGADALKQLDFEKAEAEASSIIEGAPTNSPVADAARLLRAKARAGMDRKDAALEDLRWVGQRSAEPGLRAEARTTFETLAAGRSSLTPSRPPRSEIARLMMEVRRGNTEEALKRIGGPLREWIAAVGAGLPAPAEGETREGNALKALAAEWITQNAMARDEKIDVGAGTAEVTVIRPDGPAVLTMRQQGDLWVAWSFKSLPAPAAGTNAPGPGGAVVAGGGVAALPIQPGVANIQFQAFGNGGLAQGVAVINGQVIRLGGMNMGAINLTSSSRAETNAAADVSTNEIPAEKRAEIGKLIDQLGASDAVARARARERLKELGALARPLLREREKDADIEISTTVRELLGE